MLKQIGKLIAVLRSYRSVDDVLLLGRQKGENMYVQTIEEREGREGPKRRSRRMSYRSNWPLVVR